MGKGIIMIIIIMAEVHFNEIIYWRNLSKCPNWLYVIR